MSIDIDYYRKIQNTYNTTKRGSQLYDIRRKLTNDFSKPLSSHSVTINDISQELNIVKSTNLRTKEITSPPNETFHLGDVVCWNSTYWLITEIDVDNELYTKGKMERCNWILKWQNELGEIIERKAVVLSASKYNDGTTSNKVITLGSDQLSVRVTIDSESIKLKKSMSKKFFIDNNTNDSTVYELTGTGNVPDTYDGYGVTSWIMKECVYSPTPDDILYGVCDYVAPNTIVSPPNDFTISGSEIIKIGRNYTYTVNLPDDNTVFAWNIVSDFNDDISSVVEGNNITLRINDDNYVNEGIVLQIIVDGGVNSEIEIAIVGVY